ncbi:MAG: serine/threonine-protein kinase [Gemmataceae bacterium]
MAPHPPPDPVPTGEYQPLDSPLASTVDTDAPTGVGNASALVDPPVIPDHEVTAELARGGMGCVYAGRELALDREVAIKTLLPGASPERFLTEARITARLPHPGIPPVYRLGTLPSGAPFLTMKLIRGRTLAALLRERPTLDHDRPRFLQIFEQIAQAVGFAHAQGILHRDLKPLNIMVGAFGEVQVMDWGLAREHETPPPAPSANPQQQPGEYIPPDESADTVIRPQPSGDSPHTVAGTILGTPGYLAPEQARGEPVDARADVFALGSLLVTILTGQPAVVGTSLTQIITATAAGNFTAALQRLSTCGAEPDLLDLARACLAPLPHDRPDDANVVAARMTAYHRGVDTRLRHAETSAAEALGRAAEQVRRRRQLWIASGVVTLTLLLGLAASLWQMLRANAERDAKARALDLATESQFRAIRALRTLSTEVVERQLARASTLTPEHRHFLQTILRQYEDLADLVPGDLQSRAIRAEGLLRVGRIRLNLGETREAEAALTQAADAYRELWDEAPEDLDCRLSLVKCCNILGNLYKSTGRLQQAEMLYTEALTRCRTLVAESSADLDTRLALTGSQANLALLKNTSGRLPESEALFRESITSLRHMLAEHPDAREVLGYLAAYLAELGDLLSASQRIPEAERLYREAITFRQRAVAAQPGNPDQLQILASLHHNLGNLLEDTDRPADAEVAYGEALTLYRRLAADFPTYGLYRLNLANALHGKSIRLLEDRNLKEAEEVCRQALALRQKLVAEDASQLAYRRDLARSYNILARILKDTDRLDDALAANAQALALRQKLVAEVPANQDYLDALADSHNQRAFLYMDHKQPHEVEAAFTAGSKLQQQLVDLQPDNPVRNNKLAGTLVNLANARLQAGDYSAALAFLRRAAPHHATALKGNPRHPGFRRFYRNHLMLLTQCQAGLLDTDAALATARKLADLGWAPPVHAIEAASALALCVPLAEQHDRLDSQKRTLQAQFYADQAMKMLHEAIARGFQNLKLLRTDTDLDSLRERPDFKKVLADLDAKLKP